LPMNGSSSVVGRQSSGNPSSSGGLSTPSGTSKAALYVNRGLGTFGFPVRIGVPPEITLLTLRRA
jgi:predicted MPP superfamily phosphohydrolase